MEPMDKDLLRLMANADQLQAEITHLIQNTPVDQLAGIIKACAAGDFDAFDEKTRLFVGLVAVVGILTICERS